MNDYTDWLGSAASHLTLVQRDRFEAAADAYYALPLHTDRDPEDHFADQAEDDYALSAILQTILGEDTLQNAGARAREAANALDGWIRASAALGLSEREMATQSGMSRMTLRARLGR